MMPKDAFDMWWEWAEKPLDSPLTIDAEGVAVASGPVTEVRSLSERSSGPSETAAIDKQCLKFGCREWCIRKCRHHARSPMTVLAQGWRLVPCDRAPRGPQIGAPSVYSQRSRHSVGNAIALLDRQPVPAPHQWKHISSVSMDWAQILTKAAVQILRPQGTMSGLL